MEARDRKIAEKYLELIDEANEQIGRYRQTTHLNPQEVKNLINGRREFIQQSRNVIARLDLANGTNWIEEAS